jgi:uncharacterized SAM-binding protein YcdF (DUF218 family)
MVALSKRTSCSNVAAKTARRVDLVINPMLRKLFFGGGAVAAVGLILVGLTGWPIYSDAHEDSVHKADAIVVLGGQHDGREQYGLQLLREGLAPVLMMSDPYPSSDAAMRRVCQTRVQNAEVLCKKPDESTTRGEAVLTRQLADERGWKTVIIVTWRYHLPRARLIFEKCFSDSPDALILRAVPRQYNYSLAMWEYMYVYQDLGMLKNMLRGDCK